MNWLTEIQNAKKSSIIDGKLKKVHFDFGNGKEMVEEYNLDTTVVTRRAWRTNTELGGEGKWDIEIGDPEPTCLQDDTILIKENSSQPIISRRNTKINLEWRIRNLPYPIETYSVVTDHKMLVVRTTNKKYFKKLTVPELERLNMLPIEDNISILHKFNTLIITYKKPKELLDQDQAIYREVEKVEPKNHGDMNCKPS